MQWMLLFVALVSEVVATTVRKTSKSFSRPGSSLIVVIGYALAFSFLSLTLKAIPLGVADAV